MADGGIGGWKGERKEGGKAGEGRLWREQRRMDPHPSLPNPLLCPLPPHHMYASSPPSSPPAFHPAHPAHHQRPQLPAPFPPHPARREEGQMWATKKGRGREPAAGDLPGAEGQRGGEFIRRQIKRIKPGPERARLAGEAGEEAGSGRRERRGGVVLALALSPIKGSLLALPPQCPSVALRRRE